MTAKKKRLLFMVLGVCLCVLLAVVIGDFAILENRKENVEKLNQFTGIWTDKDKHFSMEVRRVTADAIFFSLDENRNRLFAGRAIGDETYEFTYNSTGNEYLMAIRPGMNKKMTIQLLDKKIKVNFPGGDNNRQRPSQFNGCLANKTSLAEQKAYSLSSYLGTKNKPAEELERYCSFDRLEDGMIWRVHTLLDQSVEYYTTSQFGINMNSTLAECKQTLGELTSEETLNWNGISRRFENDNYISTIITNEFGVIVEMDCQLKNLPNAKREGEFFVKGNTAYRFAGNYTGKKKIVLPKGCSRIASHAFDAGEYGYSLSQKRKNTRSITIPKDVFVEENAFANCGSLKIEIGSGTKRITKGAYANIVSKKSISKKPQWVEVTLPSSLEAVEENAFAMLKPTESLTAYWEIYNFDETEIPVKIDFHHVLNSPHFTYLGDNAFGGIMLKSLPSCLTYLGKNYTLSSGIEEDNYIESEKLILPSFLKKISSNSIFLFEYTYKVYLPKQLEIIEDNAFIAGDVEQYKISPKASNFIQEKSMGKWIRSKDGSILYATDYVKYYEIPEKSRQKADAKGGLLNKYYKRKKSDVTVNVPEGIKEIREMANLDSYYKVFLPKTLQKVNVRGIFSSYGSQRVFLGNHVPEFTGTIDINEVEKFQIRVKRGLKQKMYEALKGHLIMPEESRDLRKYITTF